MRRTLVTGGLATFAWEVLAGLAVLSFFDTRPALALHALYAAPIVVLPPAVAFVREGAGSGLRMLAVAAGVAYVTHVAAWIVVELILDDAPAQLLVIMAIGVIPSMVFMHVLGGAALLGVMHVYLLRRSGTISSWRHE